MKKYNGNRPHIPADVKRRVEVDAGHKCTIKGCFETRFLEIHHINRNREDNNYNNLVLLCTKHHKMAHSNSSDKIDIKALKIYKNNLFNNTTNITINTNVDEKTAKRLKMILPTRLFNKLKSSAFGDHRTMEILEPIYNFVELSDNPTFVFSTNEFEIDKKRLLVEAKKVINYIHPYLYRDSNNSIRIGPSEGKIEGDLEQMNSWSKIIDNSTYMVWDFLKLYYNPFLEKLAKKGL